MTGYVCTGLIHCAMYNKPVLYTKTQYDCLCDDFFFRVCESISDKH